MHVSMQVLAHPTTNEFQAREPTSLGMLGEYTIVPATWVAPITPGGPNLNFTGTLQVSVCHLLTMH